MPIKLDEWFLPPRTSNGGTCVQAKVTKDAVFIRNNHRPKAGTAKFSYAEWRVFVACVKDGYYDV